MGQARLGGSTFSFMWTSTALDAMRRLQPLGLREFDVIAAPGHLWPGELTPGARRDLATELRTEGLRIGSINLPALDVNLASCAPEVRAFSVGCYEAALHLSADLGGTGVVVVPGRCSALFPPPVRDSLAWLRDSLGQLLPTAERTSQTLLIETHPQTPVPTAKATAELLASMGHAALSVAYDVANAEFIGENQVEAIRLLAPVLGQVHLSDGTRTSWRHDRAGAGTVDFGAVMAALDEISFAGLPVVEIISSDPIADFAFTVTQLANSRSR